MNKIIDFLIVLLIAIILIGLPSFFWIRWIIRAFKKKRRVGLIASVFSYSFLPSGYLVLIFGATQFMKNRIGRTSFEIHFFFVYSLLCSIAIVVLYFYARWVYTAFKDKAIKSGFLRLSFLLIIFTLVAYKPVNSIIQRRSSIRNDLGISLPYWGSSFVNYDNNISWDRNEGDIIVEIRMDEERLAEIKKQIHQSKFFAYRKEELFGADMTRWPKSDTIHYWNLRKHLEKNKLTGLWAYDKKKRLYEFYEPGLSDIANAAVLFKKDYMISATLDDKTRVLRYKRFQW